MSWRFRGDDAEVDRQAALAGSSLHGETMRWLDKLKDPDDLRWLAFLLAALVGLLAIIMSGGIVW
jgi:hypothetical protein